MKLRTRLAVAFLTITIVPMLLLSAGSCTQQLSDQVLHQGVRTYGAGGSVLRQFHADI